MWLSIKNNNETLSFNVHSFPEKSSIIFTEGMK